MEEAPAATADADGTATATFTKNTEQDEDVLDEPRPDPDAQTTVTDLLDFTEYLPSDMMRSLTLIGKLDEAHVDASQRVHELTKQWARLPSMPASERPSPIQLRADISDQLDHALSSRVFAHTEAVRMSENVSRHYNKAKILLSKLQVMMDNYPTEEEQQQRSPAASKSPQMARKGAAKAAGEKKERKKPKIPKITVPGEVLAPYDIEYDTFTDGSDDSSDDDDEMPATGRRTPAPTPRIKLITSSSKPPKSTSRSGRAHPQTPGPSAEDIAAQHAALLRPPPENAVVGSTDAPWLQLTEYELAKLRKRMKKNATWTPSETMVARELRTLGRGPEDYREAKKKAEDEGKTFEPVIPAPITGDSSGVQQLPAGAISADSAAAEEVPTSNRGMKLNEAKKLKREALAKQAAEEAEESAKKMAAAAKLFLGSGAEKGGSPSESPKEPPSKSTKTRNNSRSHSKRKRDDESEGAGAGDSEPPEAVDTPSCRPQVKRTKTETPVPPPQLGATAKKEAPTTASAPSAHTRGGAKTQTPVPLPIPLQSSASSSGARGAKSPTPNASNPATTTPVPTKLPATQTPVPLPRGDRNRSTTPAVPQVREMPTREAARRETRGDAAKRTQTNEPDTKIEPEDEPQLAVPEHPTRRSSSRGPNPAKTTPGPESHTRRPSSRGKALSQEPQPSAASDRPRRASTARNTPGPESRPPSRRTKRPAPGIVSTTSSGGSAAVGKRKAAPRKKARTTRREKGQPAEEEMEDVDDEGNPIDPDEPRYCLCNRVSFGTMIQCDNVDVRSNSTTTATSATTTTSLSSTYRNPETPTSLSFPKKNSRISASTLLTHRQSCKQEWFHLECVGLDNIPARTTKWYCPDCRKLLNIGEKGEVSARGVRK